MFAHIIQGCISNNGAIVHNASNITLKDMAKIDQL